MSRLRKHFLRRCLRTVAGESGATFIEYAMLAGLIAIIVAVAVAIFGGRLKDFFSNMSSEVQQVDTDVQSKGKINVGGDN